MGIPRKFALVAVALVLFDRIGLAGRARSSDGPLGGRPPHVSHPRTISNPYLPLTANRRCEYRGVDEDGDGDALGAGPCSSVRIASWSPARRWTSR